MEVGGDLGDVGVEKGAVHVGQHGVEDLEDEGVV